RSDVRLLPVVENLLENCVPDDDVAGRLPNEETGRKVAALYAEYKRQLISNNRADFASLLCFAHHLFSMKPAVLKQIRTMYPRICVDEFQDTNLAQYLI